MRYGIDNFYIDDCQGNNTVIPLGGRNLIVCGDNGAGKTQFLNKLFECLKVYFKKGLQSEYEFYTDELKRRIFELDKAREEGLDCTSREESIASTEKQIARTNSFRPEIINIDEVREAVDNHELFLRYFPATRQANIPNDGTIASQFILNNEYASHRQNNNDFSLDSALLFERYLVSIWNYSLLKKGNGDLDEYHKFLKKINNIEQDLKLLFEDDSLSLSFDLEVLSILIHQENKKPYSLRHLSSGFSAILAIYADLLMKSEITNQPKSELQGIVLIDEIDVHLHVTLQRKIFSFFSTSYPFIQFIVSTHSPFVIQSVSDSVIFNLSTHEQMEDLSYFSYSSIVKGLLGEEIISQKLLKHVEELKELTDKKKFNFEFHHIVTVLDKNVLYLDSRSRAALALAKNTLLDFNED